MAKYNWRKYKKEKITFEFKAYDSHATFNQDTSFYTVPTSGTYNVSYTLKPDTMLVHPAVWQGLLSSGTQISMGYNIGN